MKDLFIKRGLFIFVAILFLISVTFVEGLNTFIPIAAQAQANGSAIASGHVNVSIYNLNQSGTLLYTENFNNSISQGLMQFITGFQNISLNLMGGNMYWMDMIVNGSEVNATINGSNSDRIPFIAPCMAGQGCNISNASITGTDIDDTLNVTQGGSYFGGNMVTNGSLTIRNFFNISHLTSALRTNGSITLTGIFSPVFTVGNGFNISGVDQSVRTNGTITILSADTDDALNITNGVKIGGNLVVDGSITGNGSGLTGVISNNLYDAYVNVGSVTIDGIAGGGKEATILTWQPAAGQVWKINRMILTAPPIRGNAPTSQPIIELVMTNGTFEYPLYKLNNTLANSNTTFIFGNSPEKISSIYTPHRNIFNETANLRIKDTLYVTNSNYLYINMTNGETANGIAYWEIDGIQINNGGDINSVNVNAGSLSLSAAQEATILTWQPAAGQVWKINHMTINVPQDTDVGNSNSKIELIMSNGTFEYPLYDFNFTYTTTNKDVTLNLAEEINITQNPSQNLYQGIYNTSIQTVNIEDTIYVTNSNYLIVNVTNGAFGAKDAYWWTQAIRMQ